MPESLSRRHLLALSSGAAFSVLATACGASSSDIKESTGKASDDSVPEPTASTSPTSLPFLAVFVAPSRCRLRRWTVAAP